MLAAAISFKNNKQMDHRVEILNQIRSFAPKDFEEWQIPYIYEAMQRYSDFICNKKLDFYLKSFAKSKRSVIFTSTKINTKTKRHEYRKYTRKQCKSKSIKSS